MDVAIFPASSVKLYIIPISMKQSDYTYDEFLLVTVKQLRVYCIVSPLQISTKQRCIVFDSTHVFIIFFIIIIFFLLSADFQSQYNKI